MIGLSINLNNDKFKESFEYIKQMSKYNIPIVFGTFNLSNTESGNNFNIENLREFSKFAKTKNIRVMLDVYPTVFEKLKLKKGVEGIKQLIEIGVTDFRLDWGFSMDETVEISKVANVVVNASTIVEQEVNALLDAKINPSKILMSHNYYPKVGTALNRQWFNEKNDYLRKLGFQIQAWIPGDDKLEQPLLLRLPNIEEHRTMPTFNAYVEFKNDKNIDLICVGDRTIRNETLEKILDFDAGIMQLSFVRERMTSEFEKANPTYGSVLTAILENEHKVRPDIADAFVRDENSRFLVMEKDMKITPVPHVVSYSKIGLITIDNSNYGRYQGELDIWKKSLPIDNRLNIVGFLDDESTSLLSYLKPNMKFTLRDLSGLDNSKKKIGKK